MKAIEEIRMPTLTCLSLGPKCVFSGLTFNSKHIKGNLGTASMVFNRLFEEKIPISTRKTISSQNKFLSNCLFFCLLASVWLSMDSWLIGQVVMWKRSKHISQSNDSTNSIDNKNKNVLNQCCQISSSALGDFVFKTNRRINFVSPRNRRFSSGFGLPTKIILPCFKKI